MIFSTCAECAAASLPRPRTVTPAQPVGAAAQPRRLRHKPRCETAASRPPHESRSAPEGSLRPPALPPARTRRWARLGTARRGLYCGTIRETKERRGRRRMPLAARTRETRRDAPPGDVPAPHPTYGAGGVRRSTPDRPVGGATAHAQFRPPRTAPSRRKRPRTLRGWRLAPVSYEATGTCRPIGCDGGCRARWKRRKPMPTARPKRTCSKIAIPTGIIFTTAPAPTIGSTT